jgi:YfiH family protein
MPFHSSGNIRFYTHGKLSEFDIIHAYFTRHGGISPKPWASLNVGLGQDDPRRVNKNRILAFTSIGREPKSIYDVWQVHGNKVICVNAPKESNVEHQKADGILTNNPEVTLFMRFADCVPILLFDPLKNVIGIIHSGWQGTIKKIVVSGVEKMIEVYDSEPSDIIACFGPSICPDHYEIGQNVEDQVKLVFRSYIESVLINKDHKKHFDLWAANRILLESVGVHQVDTSRICTACNNSDWFSHRKEKGQTGRFGALLALR